MRRKEKSCTQGDSLILCDVVYGRRASVKEGVLGRYGSVVRLARDRSRCISGADSKTRADITSSGSLPDTLRDMCFSSTAPAVSRGWTFPTSSNRCQDHRSHSHLRAPCRINTTDPRVDIETLRRLIRYKSYRRAQRYVITPSIADIGTLRSPDVCATPGPSQHDKMSDGPQTDDARGLMHSRRLCIVWTDRGTTDVGDVGDERE